MDLTEYNTNDYTLQLTNNLCNLQEFCFCFWEKEEKQEGGV